MGRSRRLHVVVAGWDPERTTDTCRLIDATLARNRVAVGQRVLVQNGARTGAPARDFTVIRGDNRGLDIGAMGQGVAHILESGAAARHDCLLIANDMLPEYEEERPVLRHVVPRLVRHIGSNRAIAGKVWRSKEAHELHGLPSRAWVQSHCFLIGVGLARQIDLPALLTEAGEGTLAFDASGNIMTQGLVDPAFVDFITHGLVRWQPSRPNWQWHRAEVWDPSHADQLSRKAVSILRERLVSAKVVAGGGYLLNVATMFSPGRWHWLPDGMTYLVRRMRGAGQLRW